MSHLSFGVRELHVARCFRLPRLRHHIAVSISFARAHRLGIQARSNRSRCLISGLHNPCLPLALTRVVAASPPDVRRGYASPLKLTEIGLRPWSGLWPIELEGKPEPGAQPNFELELNGEAEPRLTSGGEAAATSSRVIFRARPFRSDEFKSHFSCKTVEPLNLRSALGD
jgi:hypothetical protein